MTKNVEYYYREGSVLNRLSEDTYEGWMPIISISINKKETRMIFEPSWLDNGKRQQKIIEIMEAWIEKLKAGIEKSGKTIQ